MTTLKLAELRSDNISLLTGTDNEHQLSQHEINNIHGGFDLTPYAQLAITGIGQVAGQVGGQILGTAVATGLADVFFS